MDKEGYPEKYELDLIRQWDCKDVFNMLDYIVDRWNYNYRGVDQEWKYNSLFKRYELHLELHTIGWSGNEDLISAILDNFMFRMLWYTEWKRGGHYKFEINPSNIGFKTVAEYCRENNMSRQYVHKIKDRFEWVIISQRKRLLRLKR